ncbi:hypothetical protein ARMA_0692 [Ardenticatena maritima]|uniref:Uncharacterized protein n=1 Tax=Ardenticatena maritima TaxID=872965 RepID=A0A0M8K7W8_9CHLR|nr:hypothetical protein ARMA_0692 [Ardenticatena maritima]
MWNHAIITNQTSRTMHSPMAGYDGVFGGAYFYFYFGWRWKAPGCDAPHSLT